MSRHIWVNPNRLHKGWATRTVDGIELTVEISPYSVPKVVTGSYDKKSGNFLIEFKYIDKEGPKSEPRRLGDVTIFEGKHSRKILKLMIHLDSPALGNISLITLKTSIVDAFRERIKDVTDPDAPGTPDILNQEIAEEILDPKTLQELAEELVN